jgi:hypothetical protein
MPFRMSNGSGDGRIRREIVGGDRVEAEVCAQPDHFSGHAARDQKRMRLTLQPVASNGS